MLDSMLLSIPGVQAKRAFGYPSYAIYGKTFAFVGGDGFSVKVGRERAQILIESDPRFEAFEPKEGMVWRDWVSGNPLTPVECSEMAALFHESLEYVAEQGVER